jgi:hypothetical protein
MRVPSPPQNSTTFISASAPASAPAFESTRAGALYTPRFAFVSEFGRRTHLARAADAQLGGNFGWFAKNPLSSRAWFGAY